MKIQPLSPKFSEADYKIMVSYLQTMFQSLTLGDNLSGQVAQNVFIPNGDTIRIAHGLKVVPAYRIIVRQRGNALITDGDDEVWNENYIVLKNQGPDDVTVSVLIMRG